MQIIEVKYSDQESFSQHSCTPVQMVAQLYKGLLSRTASESELKFHASKFLGANVEIALEQLSRDMSHCEEFITIRGPDIALSHTKKSERARRYENVISFGGHCYTGKLLQKALLKKFSTPFD